MTLLEIVNKIMRRLREAEVLATTDTDYATLVAEYVSESHQMVMDHDWTALRHYVDIDLVANQQSYDISRLTADGGAVLLAGRVTNQGSVLLYDTDGCPQCWVFDDDTETSGSQLYLVDERDLQQLYQGDRVQTGEDPTAFSIRQSATQQGLEVGIWPLPEATRRLRLRFWTPEDVLATDGTDDATTIQVPWRPVFLAALAGLLNERGEELGEPGNLADARAINALQSAIESDINARQRTNEYEFRVD